MPCSSVHIPERIIHDLIFDFAPAKLNDFFRSANSTYEENPEDLDYLFAGNEDIKENYSGIRRLGTGRLTADIYSGAPEEEFMVVTAKSAKPLNVRSSKRRQFEIARTILKTTLISYGFFIFYDDKGRFRFSFIYSQTEGARQKFSSFKRYTYFVSPELTNKTFISRIKKADFCRLKSILEAFSVEPLTKEFYEKLQKWYFRIIENGRFPLEVEENQARKKEAVMRLITRLMFIWFMREKQLIPDELFRENFLKEHIKDFGQKDHYYLAVLQNLFFATLNVPMNDRRFRSTEQYRGRNPDFGNQYVYRYYDLMERPGDLEALFRTIPFLNGGLFECLDYTDDEGKRHYIDGFTEVADDNQRPHLADTFFFDEEENNPGLINIFRSYNFTIDENDPNDVEVALDPELLGKVFENLLAVFNPETADTARRATGSFYTPREIVDYMVTESLLEYFRDGMGDDFPEEAIRLLLQPHAEGRPELSDAQRRRLIRLINELRIVDPAVGSGAFPMAILNKLTGILEKLDPENRLWKEEQFRILDQISDPVAKKALKDELEKQFARKNADFSRKLHLIQKVIYGVDIQTTAIEIAKLRFFISLLVEEELAENEYNKGIMPLPNLDFKLMQGNSLIDNFKGIRFRFENTEEEGVWQRNLEWMLIDNKLQELERLKDRFLVEWDHKEKRKLKKKIQNLIVDIYKSYLSYFEDINLPEWRAHIKLFEEYIKEKKPKPFFLWRIFFAEVFSEKGGFDIVIGNPPYIQLTTTYNGTRLNELYENEGFESFRSSGDIYILFYELGLKILHPGGILAYITSNKWMRAGYGEKLRGFLSRYKPQKLLDLGPGVFENATVDTNILIIKKESTAEHVLDAVDLDRKEKLQHPEQIRFTRIRRLDQNNWLILSPIEQQIKEKIEAVGTPLKEWDIRINRGILTGFNEAFIIDGDVKEELIRRDTKSAEIIKPILRGRDIKRYKAEFADKWLIATFPSKHIDITHYPAVYEFLAGFKPKLEQTGRYLTNEEKDKIIEHANSYGIIINRQKLNKSRKRTNHKWYETQDSIGYWGDFFRPKIGWKAVGRNLSFAVIPEGTFISAPAAFMVTENEKFVLGLLQSKLYKMLIYNLSDTTGAGDIMLNIQSLLRISLPTFNNLNTIHHEINNLTNKILQTDNERLLSEYEQKKNELIYKIFNLTSGEISHIENNY